MAINKKIIQMMGDKQRIELPLLSSTSTIYQLDFSLQEQGEYFYGSFQFPIIGFSYFWHPTREYDYTLPNMWSEPIVTKINYSLPIFCFFDESSHNKRTLAFSETIHVMETSFGVHEETATIVCSFRVKRSEIKDCGLELYVLDEPITFSQAITKARDWLYTVTNQKVFPVPQKTKKNVYSTWYSYHQLVSDRLIAYESEQFGTYNLQTIIVDDGWQTDDSSRRYSYAGDWEISKNKFPEMRKSIAALQKEKINYLLWISLPYIGIRSKHWAAFEDKFLYIDSFQKAGVLDLRFPEVRTYLLEKTICLVRELQLDGVKIDFLDVFKEDVPKEDNKNWDISCLEEAIQQFLSELSQSLQAINPEIMIEYREDYFGPFMNQVGNIFRVKDCPNNYVRNRIGIAKLRLLCKKTSIHSDMIMWHPDEVPEKVAKQLVNCLFGVPQISMKLHELSLAHQKLLKFWLDYIQENQKVLLEGEYEVFYPQNQFTLMKSSTEKKSIIAMYQNNYWLELGEVGTPEIDIVNASESRFLLVHSEKLRWMEVVTKDCQGNVVEQMTTCFNIGITNLTVPISGLACLKENLKIVQ
ncbi:hypothetical protein IGI37_000815 [Enterococcus sp. AZ194]|uniref:glycoside hydrolase family 36 protein n=1 Tax=Enterococcus sp. AZ194 TaxID=2774629 RepID=UPI003F210ED2